MTKLTLKKPLSMEMQEKLMKLKEPPLPESAALKPDAKSVSAKGKKKAQPQKPDSSKEPKKPSPKKSAQKKIPCQTPEEITRIALEKFEAAKTWLEATFSKLINFSTPKPLKLGIDQEIMALIPPTLTKSQVRNVLKAYVKSEAYLKAVLEDGWRYNLAGEKVEEVLAAHKDYARKKLLIINKAVKLSE